MPQLLSKKQSLFGFAFVLCYAFILGLTELSVIAVLPELASHFTVKLQDIALVVSLFALSYAFFTPLFSVGLQNFSIYKNFIALSSLFLVLCILTNTSLSTEHFTLFFFVRVAIASLCGILLALLLQFLKYLELPCSSSLATALVFSGFALASLLGMPFFQQLAKINLLKEAFLLFSLFTLITSLGVLVCFFPLLKQTKKEKSSSTQEEKLSFHVIYKENLNFIKSPIVWRGIIYSIFYPASAYVLFTYLSPLFTDVLHFSKDYLGGFLFLFGLLSFIASTLSSSISKLEKHIQTLQALALGLSTLFLVFLFALKVEWFWVALFCLSLLACFMSIINVPLQEIFEYESEENYPLAKNLASSIYSLSFNLGIALGAFLAGELYERGALSWLVLSAFALAFASFVAFKTLALRSQNTPSS